MTHDNSSISFLHEFIHSHSKYGLETQLKSLFYLFVRLYAILCTVTEPIVSKYNEGIIQSRSINGILGKAIMNYL